MQENIRQPKIMIMTILNTSGNGLMEHQNFLGYIYDVAERLVQVREILILLMCPVMGRLLNMGEY